MAGMHITGDEILSAITTVGVAFLAFRFQRRENKEQAREKAEAESQRKIDSVSTDLRVFIATISPLPKLIEVLESRVDNHTTEIAIMRTKFETHEDWARDNVARLDKKTFYNGGME